MKRWLCFAVVGGAALVAACSEHTTSPSAPSVSLNQVSPAETHKLPTIELYRAANGTNPLASPPDHPDAKPGSGGSNTGIIYHGGPLLISPSIAAVYWSNRTIYSGGPAAGSNGSGSQDGSLIGYFLSNLGASSYWNINTTYYNGSNVHVTRSLNYSQFWAANVNVPASGSAPTDANMENLLITGFNTGKLTFSPTTIYAIFSDAGVNLGGGFGSSYCAYHGHFTWNGNDVKYAAMPHNIDFPSACTDGQAPNGDAAADAEVNTLAHESEEATTDEDLNAWYDRRGNENADKCAWNFGAVSGSSGAQYNITVGSKHFMVQQNWINSGSGGCRQGL